MANIDYNTFIDKFKDDSYNLLNELEAKLLELEKDTANHKLIGAVFRAMHTLKGAGGMFGYNAISEYTHFLEEIYDKIREDKLSLSRDIFNVTFDSVDHLRNLLGDQELKDEHLAHRHSELIERIEQVIKETHQKIAKFSLDKTKEAHVQQKEPATWYIHFKCTEELLFRGINIVYLFEDLAQLGKFHINKIDINHPDKDPSEETWGIYLQTEASYAEIEEVFIFVSEYVKILKASDLDLLDPLSASKLEANKTLQKKSISELAEMLGDVPENTDDLVPKAVNETTTKEPSHKEITSQSQTITRISVSSDKLDKLMYLVSELFTTKSELLMATESVNWERVRMAVEKVDKLSNQFRNNALNIRLIPLKELTHKFKRLIRDLSQSLEKKIDFEISGDETELDKNLVDSLSDPFMHIIRNCVDHGIETPDKRQEKGKSETGVIKFTASQTGNFINIQISDDGKGIDTEYIRSKATEKGFIPPNAHLTKTELFDLIFLPGFSTAESLSHVSGRGVGMDVVKRAITDLRGSVQIESETDKGTVFTIKLQQTISIIDTLLIKTGNSYFTIHLEEIELCSLEAHNHLFERYNNHWQLNNELIPFIYLRSAFHINGQPPDIEKIVVVQKQNKRFAIVTDEIIGQHQAVLKPIGDMMKKQDFITGASIIGNGDIALMLDTCKLAISSQSKQATAACNLQPVTSNL
jgi:two-component system, chemotaxis family, sensor kinase CheA